MPTVNQGIYFHENHSTMLVQSVNIHTPKAYEVKCADDNVLQLQDKTTCAFSSW